MRIGYFALAGCFSLTLMCTFFLGISAQAQIISQTPRPEVPNPEAQTVQKIETIKRKDPIGRSGTVIQIPRAGALLFAGFDRNGDYIIDRKEVVAGIARAFVVADRDNNQSLSLVELERWRVAALGSEHASPSNFAFAPNFARTVSRETFSEVLTKLADTLDKDDQSEMDGKISLSDLLKDYRPPHQRQNNNNCIDQIREERRRAEQQCRNNRRR